MKNFRWILVVIVLSLWWKTSTACRNSRRRTLRGPFCIFPRRLFMRIACIIQALRPCRYKWGECTVSCGGGLSYPYKIKRRGVYGRCKMPTAPKKCNTHYCPVDGTWSNWSSWSMCSVSCGTKGMQTRHRSCEGQKYGGGACLGSSKEIRSCLSYCPVDCAWTPWQSWTSCTATCGGGHQSRNRTFAVEADHGGRICIGPSYHAQECNNECCPVQCSWTDWGMWSSCSTSCGLGVYTRKRTANVAPSCGGAECAGNWTETRQCSNKNCCPVDCEWGMWGAWGRCSSSCGTGTEARYRPTAVIECCGGAPCDGKNHELRSCFYHHCHVHCKWTTWGAWAPCSKSCDLGVAHRTRSIATEAAHGGQTCLGNKTVERHCNPFCCEEHCDWQQWSQWSTCSATCGLGKQTRARSVKIHPDCKVQRCIQPFHEERNCTDTCCAVDCEMTSWTNWTECTTSCGGTGMKHRFKNVTIEPKCGGKQCDNNTFEIEACSRFCFNRGTLDDGSCSCVDGWEGTCCEEDADECKSVVCPENSGCFNSYGSYECVCHHNFTKEEGQCVPSTACHTEDHDCHENAQCVSEGFQYICKCEPGFEGNGTFCSDIDECEIERNEMFWIMENGGKEAGDLSEINSMSEGLSPLCHQDERCMNIIGSYVCVCDDGFFKNSTTCQDIDECLLSEMIDRSNASTSRTNATQNSTSDTASVEPCHRNATCQNGRGSYSCDCNDGFYGDGFICKDVDECASSPCQNGGVCKNMVNTFRCECKPGFVGALCIEVSGVPPELLQSNGNPEEETLALNSQQKS